MQLAIRIHGCRTAIQPLLNFSTPYSPLMTLQKQCLCTATYSELLRHKFITPPISGWSRTISDTSNLIGHHFRENLFHLGYFHWIVAHLFVLTKVISLVNRVIHYSIFPFSRELRLTGKYGLRGWERNLHTNADCLRAYIMMHSRTHCCIILVLSCIKLCCEKNFSLQNIPSKTCIQILFWEVIDRINEGTDLIVNDM